MFSLRFIMTPACFSLFIKTHVTFTERLKFKKYTIFAVFQRRGMTTKTRYTIVLALTAFISIAAGAQDSRKMAYRGFVGGMMLHSGYVQSGSFQVTSQSGTMQDISMSGAPYGIGGSIRFLFGRHLRVGTEGYVSNLAYGQHRSHAKTGWGGLLADCAWDFRDCRLFVGGTVGGGGQTNTIILSPAGNDYKADDIAYRKYTFAALAPFAGAEIRLTDKVDLVLKADWLLNISGRREDFVSGPRLYVGVMFGHKK